MSWLLRRHSVNCQQLTAVKNEESSLEGSTVTLTYKYSQQATGGDQFFWYRQHSGNPPEFLIYHYGTQSETKARLSAAVSADKNQISMKISSAAVTDSAVYYCALRPTVTCQQLTAVKDEESSLEGSTVTLTYTYSRQATGVDGFYWYQQHPGKPPELLIFHLGSQNQTKARLSVSVSDDKNQISMKISSAAVTDSAVYYCAVRPTVTGNSKTLYKNLWSKDNRKLHNIH
ncbi:uncharacterized protein LOC127535477 [Acanthochromis polyacanthus]|uniref:uncharacterized protein LOC127535477 n=1 Tax=Acanthochromis polyacanthus TaxID=80966 RepID=UPI00223472FC|nr:uncharacterized protein LOC127535477 [Acanthochromis polyacanthus]